MNRKTDIIVIFIGFFAIILFLVFGIVSVQYEEHRNNNLKESFIYSEPYAEIGDYETAYKIISEALRNNKFIE